MPVTSHRLRLSVLSALLCGLSLATAAPVPKADGTKLERLLARVRIDNVGSALTQPAVAADIQLDDGQAKELDAVWEELGKELSAKVAAKRAQGNGDAEAQLDLFGQVLDAGKEFDAKVMKVLSREQVLRLKQIQLQKEGPAALLGRHAVRALAPTPEQEDAMAAELAKWKKVPMIDEVVAMSYLEQSPNAAAEMAAAQRILDKHAAEADAVSTAMLKHLTKEQRDTWKLMTGEPVGRTELIRAGTAFGDAKLMKVMVDAERAAAPQPAAPPVVPAGGAVPPPPPPPPVEKK